MVKNTPDFMSAIIDKHNRLASIKGKRVILVGGSNVAFGVDSKKLQDTFKIPVVNLSLHAGLGLDFMLNEAKSIARKGDIFVLSTEYYINEPDADVKANVTKFYPKSLSYFEHPPMLLLKMYYTNRVTQMRVNALNFPLIAPFLNAKERELQKLTNEKIPVYARRSFNEYGDAIGHLEKPNPKGRISFHFKMNPYRYYEGIKKLNEFYSYCISNDIKVFFLYPALAETTYLENKDLLERNFKDYSKDLKIPVLNTPTSFVMNDSLFFDTYYHLTKHGRAIRTNKMIEMLKNNIKQ